MLDIIMYHYIRKNEDRNYDCYARRINECETYKFCPISSNLEPIFYLLKNKRNFFRKYK